MCCIEETEDNKGRTRCGPLHLGVLINGPVKGSTASQNVAQNGNWQVLGAGGACGRIGVTADGRTHAARLPNGTYRTHGTYGSGSY